MRRKTNKTNIEIILEECGWKYSTREKAWRMAHLRILRDKLKACLVEGNSIPLREKIVEVLLEVEDATPQEKANIEATIERLKLRNKKET
jgi:hypothetical protein